ncbi:hypothetical protein QEG98_36020 [Myxococcus sp. MxC21-1]|nr:hypothetical protein QEG98_36020 [Myxococcus sp. MxC21-1]
MGAKRYLFTFGLAAGLVSALLLGGMLRAVSGAPLPNATWAVVLLATPALYLAGDTSRGSAGRRSGGGCAGR